MSSTKPVNSPATSTVPPKKRRNASIAEIGESSGNTSSPLQQPNHDDDEPVSKRGRQQLNQESSTTPPSAPVMALPPPLLSYPPHHPHQLAVVQSPYYHPLYHAGPFYLPVGSPPQPPMAPQSPLPSRQRSGSNATRILPKLSSAAESTNEQTCFASPPLHASSPADYHPVYHPFALPITAAPAASPSSSTTGRDGSSTADQREQARKLSHSAIERRRRERINDKIVQLRQLIPSCANQEHLHKMTVLQSAIDYITYLKDVVSRLDGEDRVHVDLKMAKVPRSMVPKEVEAFTTQFSVNNKTSKSSDGDRRNRRRSSDDETLSNSSIATLPPEHQQQPPKDTQNDGRASSSEEEVCNPLEQPSSQKNLETFDGQKGIKPIDIIKAGTSTNNKLVATPIPSPLSLHQQDWTPSSLPSPMYRPVERGSNSSITSSPTVSPAGSPSHSWNDEQHSSLPTPTLTPRPTTEPHSTKHMSLNNILC